jgi:excisionase family DNA binding protein
MMNREPSIASAKTAHETLIEQIRRKEGAWTIEGLAAFLEVSPKLLYKLVKGGEIQAYRIGILIRIDGHDAADYLTAHATIPQRPQPPKLR